MGMYNHLSAFFSRITKDENLLRLLIYQPKHGEDDPLSPSKPNIIGSSSFYTAITRNIVRAPKSTDLPQTSMCRVCMYFGYNTTTNKVNSNKVFNQDIVFDVYSHIDGFETMDCRSLKICDRINDLLHEEYITGIGKVVGYKTYPITDAPSGYIGYKMVFSFGSTK